MKLIADIGTNVYRYDGTRILLHHFLKHYHEIGITEFILHGNTELIERLESKEDFGAFKIKFVKISKEQFLHYKERDCEQYRTLRKEKKLYLYHQQPASGHICPLWLIQNDLKKKYLKDDELCVIVDLDEFIDIKKERLKIVEDKSPDFCAGVMVDRFFKNGEINNLKIEEDIFEQMTEKASLTKHARRAVGKIWLTKGYLEHGFGHHCLYKKSRAGLERGFSGVNIWHMKYFKENLEGPLGIHSKEVKFIKDGKIISSAWKKMTENDL